MFSCLLSWFLLSWITCFFNILCLFTLFSFNFIYIACTVLGICYFLYINTTTILVTSDTVALRVKQLDWWSTWCSPAPYWLCWITSTLTPSTSVVGYIEIYDISKAFLSLAFYTMNNCIVYLKVLSIWFNDKVISPVLLNSALSTKPTEEILGG